MSSYTAAQYAAQRMVMQQAARANAAGVCVICGQPQATTATGERRITCGSRGCMLRWLPGRYEEEESERGEE